MVIAGGVAACSSEAVRFNSNPYATQRNSNEVTGSVQPRVPTGNVQTTALPPPGGTQYSQPSANDISGGARGMASYSPGQSAAPATVASMQPPATRHALPPPISQSSAPKASSIHKSSNIAKSQPASKGASTSVHVAASGDTLSKIARAHNMSAIELARLNKLPPHTKLKVGDRVNVPASLASRPEASKTAQPKSLSAPAKGKSEAKVDAKDLPKAGPTLANHQPVERASVASSVDDQPATNAVRAGNAGLSFRWPAKGRIIAGFGPKTNGQANDGINIALPEGTPIKAAEDGVVAYAGNELKGYGNLVLVRHADGFVTAYAHAKELLVKRGDSIKRGQVIARSGQTGNVDAPQLHFEIRKGPSPIDPMPHLSGG